MPENFQHTHDLLSRRPRRRHNLEPNSALSPETHSSDKVEHASETQLAQFSLLADPTTISGTSETKHDESSQEEIERLRSALHARSREIAALQQGSTMPADTALPTVDAGRPETHRVDGKLLNSAQARQLAEDARAREKAIRAELSTARNAMNSESTELPAAAADFEEAQQKWQTRSLVRGPTASKEAPPERAPGHELGASLETALRAETRELRATLSIARDTTRGQRELISELRSQLAEKTGLLESAHKDGRTPETENASEQTATVAERTFQRRAEDDQAELERLRGRLRLNGREMEARDAERILLRQTLDERENDLSARHIQLDDLRDHFDAQGHALDQARLQLDQERNRNTATQQLLSRLRQTLGDDPLQVPTELVARVPELQPEPGTISAMDLRSLPVDPTAASGTAAAQQTIIDAAVAEVAVPNRLDEWTEEAEFSRPPIFDAWQDDQVRRHFGPMGIDTIIDLLRAPLARRTSADRSEMPLVLVGRGARRWASTLAEGLIQNGTAAFTIYVCDPLAPEVGTRHDLDSDAPTLAFLRELPFPTSPEAFRTSLDEVDPVALVSRDFLSSEADVAPWLDVLSELSARGTCLLFSERTGVGPASAPPELCTIGDRIWELMPERYTRIANGSTRIPNWREAFMRSQQEFDTVPANDLLAKLRSQFRLEMLARFGFLAEPFVATPIGENFETNAARDRKFLSQMADVDDRKIEAGIVPGLHLVAIVDREADEEAEVAIEA